MGLYTVEVAVGEQELFYLILTWLIRAFADLSVWLSGSVQHHNEAYDWCHIWGQFEKEALGTQGVGLGQ